MQSGTYLSECRPGKSPRTRITPTARSASVAPYRAAGWQESSPSSRYDRPGFVNRGATVRVVLEMSRPLRAWAVIPGGQSGHPLDAHYDDQIAAWLAGEHDALAAAPEQVAGHTLRLRPAPTPAP